MDNLRKKLEALAFRPVEIDQIMGIVSDHIVQKHAKVESKQELIPLDVDALAERIAIQAVDYKYSSGYEITMFKKNIIPEISKYGVPKQEEKCDECFGHGTEICNNPDHGFIEGMPGDTGRLGCPVCGRDEYYRVKNTKCEKCNGTGKNISMNP